MDITCYYCEVTNVYRGEAGGTIFLSFFNGTVEQGQTYLVFVERAGPESLVYSLTAQKNSVFPAGSDEAAEVLAMLEE